MLAGTIDVPAQSAATPRPDGAALHHWLGVEQHLRRSLDAASREYARALALDPPRDPTPDQQRLVRRFAPRLYTTPSEFFPLADIAVIVHPDRPLIAYHLFWADDIDFPEDNDPSDHEVVWIQHSADGQRLEQVWTYFHGRILAGGDAALADARAHHERPRIDVQWGKHGSMPAGWARQTIAADRDDTQGAGAAAEPRLTLEAYNRATCQALAKGRRLGEHPLGQRLGWPPRFTGTWEDFIDFSRLVDPVAQLDRTRLVKVSRWNSATINQHFLAYNFRPKHEWPSDASPAVASATGVSAANGRRLVDAASIDAFQLPAKTVFDAAMPRYPNLWLYLDASLVESYESAVALLTGLLRETMRLEERFGPFPNPEGCDFEGGLEHLQPWQTREQRAQQHAHAFHIRYYYSALARQRLERVTLPSSAGPRAFYRLAASAHYEVEHFHPLHADVESCPICGRTGEYATVAGNLVEMVHDPLGVELALTGTIRGQAVRVDGHDPWPLRGVDAMTSQFDAQSWLFPANERDRNTLRIGVIVIAPPAGR